VRFPVDVGPKPAEVVRSLRAAVVGTLGAGVGSGHVDYPAAQAYAAGLIAMRCVEEAGGLEDGALAEAARGPPVHDLLLAVRAGQGRPAGGPRGPGGPVEGGHEGDGLATVAGRGRRSPSDVGHRIKRRRLGNQAVWERARPIRLEPPQAGKD
jgi:hypothetical protein